MMDFVVYCGALALIKIIRALPLRAVAHLGRAGGLLGYYLDARHRGVTRLNLTRCFPDLPPARIAAMAREQFRRLGENFASAVKTSGMRHDQILEHVEIAGADKVKAHGSRGAVVAIGHFGNFELFAKLQPDLAPLRFATTYRPLKQVRLDKLLRNMREESGCLFLDRRAGSQSVRETLAKGGVVLGLLSDQHAGSTGLRVPFFGHECSVNSAPALLAQRYGLPLHTAFCFRTAPGRWRIEVGDEIPTRCNDERRPPRDIMAEVNAAFETAVRRDPPNWFWVHDRWRFRKGVKKRLGRAAPPAPPAP